jgi:hypothetical protein
MHIQKLMHLNIPTLHERILSMTNEELEQLAQSEAFAMADSSRLEGLTLDHERIRTALLNGYKKILATTHFQPDADDQ